MTEPAFRRILLKLSGEALMGDLPYGADAEHVLALVRADAALGGRLMQGHPYVRAEVVHAVRAEMALTLEDVLIRRLHLFYEAADGGMAVAEEVARRMAAEPGIGWTDAEAAAQVEAYRAAVRETREFGR